MMIQDPVMLLSFINTQLRDNYDSLDALADDKDLDKEEILKKLSEIGYKYNEKQNKFV